MCQVDLAQGPRRVRIPCAEPTKRSLVQMARRLRGWGGLVACIA
jgi:hypothetical protein